MRDPDCLFCKIVAGDVPATLVREDERTVAFMDINPAISRPAPGPPSS
jgi:histidine triad (HIT) family protein